MLDNYDRLAARQHALVTTPQVEELGGTSRQVSWEVTQGRLITVRHQVYRIAGAPVTWEQALLAAVLSVGRGAVISYTTAAAVWNLRHSNRDERACT